MLIPVKQRPKCKGQMFTIKILTNLTKGHLRYLQVFESYGIE